MKSRLVGIQLWRLFPFFIVLMLFIVLTPVSAQESSGKRIDPSWLNTIEIHKFENPATLSQRANGLPQDTTGLVPVSGAAFVAKQVPDIDLISNSGQRDASKLTVEEAASRVADQPVAASVVTDINGNATMSGLPVGLYLVQEINIQAGFVGSAPFLVALPLTDPVDKDRWLQTVHVYPKDAKVSITLDVIDEHAVAVGETIFWISKSTIPLLSEIDGYLVEQVIDPDLELVGEPGSKVDNVRVSIDCSECPNLTVGEDYTIVYNDSTKTISVNFTPRGLRKLEQSVNAHPSAVVRIDYDTKVLNEGIHVNNATVYGSQEAIVNRLGVSDDAVTKWGPLSIVVHERGKPSNRIPDAIFQLYETKEDAIAGRNPISVNGVDRWTTDSNGQVIIYGLRFSGFYNGLEQPRSSEHYNKYWAAPINTPKGWTWVSDAPLVGEVHSDIEYEELVFQVYKDGPGSVTTPPTPPKDPDPNDPPSSGEPDNEKDTIIQKFLPKTGAQIMGLVMVALVLVASGILVLTKSRRRTESS